MTTTATQRIVRGQTLFAEIEFLDEDGAVITAGIASATLHLAYDVAGVSTPEVIALTNEGAGLWAAEWDTGPADEGLLFWWAQSAGSPHAASQGRLRIDANPANPQT